MEFANTGAAVDTSAYLNVDFFQAALELGLRSEGVTIEDVRLRPASGGGDNYCSNIYEARIQYRSKEDKAEEDDAANSRQRACSSVRLIVKSMPAHKQGILASLRIYSKELFFYLDVKPQLEALMWHVDAQWRLGAEHFYATAQPEQTLVFADLRAAGFELRSRQLGLHREHAVLVMAKLAQYHALTMVQLQHDAENRIATRFPYGLLNEPSIRAPPFRALFGAQLLQLIGLLAADEDATCRLVAAKLRNYQANLVERVLDAILPLTGQLNVLNHGDVWVNNLFFRYAEAADVAVKDTGEQRKGSAAGLPDTPPLKDRWRCAQPLEVRFIDFQLCFYGSLGFDVNYFLNTSVQLDVLKTERSTLLNVYYDALVRTLQELPPTGAPLPTYEEVLLEVRQREAYGFFVAFGLFPLMSMERLDSTDNSLERLHDAEFARRKIQLMFASNPRTYETLRYAVQRLNDLGIFD